MRNFNIIILQIMFYNIIKNAEYYEHFIYDVIKKNYMEQKMKFFLSFCYNDLLRCYLLFYNIFFNDLFLACQICSM